MKEIKCILKKSVWLFAVVSAILFAGCQDEDDQQNSNNNNDSTTDYPATADVIHDAVTDIDGNTYDAVRIGDQIWMASNLRTTREPNGAIIREGNPNVVPQIDRYRYATNSDITTYGYVYNLAAALNTVEFDPDNSPFCDENDAPSGVQGICPNGWHLPSKMEYERLCTYIKTHITEYYSTSEFTQQQVAYLGSMGCLFDCALASNSGWDLASDFYNIGYNQSVNNGTGFCAMPAGVYRAAYEYIYVDQDHNYNTAIQNGEIVAVGKIAYFWKADGRCYIQHDYPHDYIAVVPRTFGLTYGGSTPSIWDLSAYEIDEALRYYQSVRCLKDY